MSHILSAEPLFIEGRSKLREQNYEAAIEFFSELVQARVDKFGDSALEAAPAWLEYGSALLRKEEAHPSDDLLGAASAEAKRQAQALGQELGGAANDDDEDEEDASDGQEEEGENADEEEQSDMQVAWECLEVARKALEAAKDCPGSVPYDTDTLLAEVYERLGDLQKFNGAYPDAISEYGRCVQLRQAICKPDDRSLAMAHFHLAVAHIYNSGEQGVDVMAEKQNALRHYKAARAAIAGSSGVLGVDPSSSTDKSDTAGNSDAVERQDLSDELDETIKALTIDIKASMQAAFNAVASGSSSSRSSMISGGITTTIGFGAATSTTSVGFGASASSISGKVSSSLATASSSVPKVETVSNGSSPDGCMLKHVAAESDRAQKKQRVEEVVSEEVRADATTGL